MKRSTLYIFLFLITSSIFAQIQLPQDGLKHHFKFDDASNLGKATLGNNLVPDVIPNFTQSFKSVQGPASGDLAVEVGLGSFYRLTPDFEPNGSATAQRVNQYALVIDFYMPQSGVWYAFHATDNDGDPVKSDWDSFIKDNGTIGVGTTGYSFYAAQAKQWYRLVITADLGKSYKYYLDGQLLQDGGARAVDDRLSLPSINGANQLLLFGDNDGEDAPIYISQLAVYNRPLTDTEIYALGGYNHSIPLKNPTSIWNFDDAKSVLTSTVGVNLKSRISVNPVTGSTSTDGAVIVGTGNYLIAQPNIMPNSTGTKVNQYTLRVDFKVDELGKTYSIYQTDSTNTSDAELLIDKEGRIGHTALGYSNFKVKAGEWYRLVVNADLGNYIKLYVDGDSVHFGGKQAVDNNYAIQPRNGHNRLLFFADDNGEDGVISASAIVLYNRSLSSSDIKGLGSFEHGGVNTEVTGAKTAVHFNGTEFTNKYAKVTKKDDSFNFGEGDFTIEVWVKPDIKYDSDPALISDKDWGSGGNPGWVLSIRGDDWKFNAADANRNRYDVSGPRINDGNWHHLAVVAKQDSGLKVITDNLVSVWSGGDAFFKAGNIDNTVMPLCFAQDGTTKYSDAPPAPAQIDEIRIWKGAAVDPRVIIEWRNKELDKTHPNWNSLVGWWKFDEGTGNIVADKSGKGNNAELIGDPKWVVSYAAMGNVNHNSTYSNNVRSVWGAGTKAASGGMEINAKFPLESKTSGISFSKISGITGILDDKKDNPFIVFGHNGVKTASKSDLPSAAVARLGRIWNVEVTEVKPTSLNISFDLSELGGSGNAGTPADYLLLFKSGVGAFQTLASTSVKTSGDTITFSGVAIEKGFYTLGSKNLTTASLGGLTVGVKENEGLPTAFNLYNNYPNPFNPSTLIKYDLPVSANVKLVVYDVLGSEVATLVNENKSAGSHQIEWNAATQKNISSGMYIYKIQANGVNGQQFVNTKKMLLVK